jgi:hypothetical protein
MYDAEVAVEKREMHIDLRRSKREVMCFRGDEGQC